MDKISHYDLCKLTAEWIIKKSKVVLYEYQSYSTGEFPDVLRFKDGYTWLYEIKVSRQDFKKDCEKNCRTKTRIKYFPGFTKKIIKERFNINWKEYGLEEFVYQAPHLGRSRFYVCPKELIQPDEIINGWGLYWFTGKQFKKKKDSKKFKANIYEEMRILEHAFRKYACGDGHNVLVNRYK